MDILPMGRCWCLKQILSLLIKEILHACRSILYRIRQHLKVCKIYKLKKVPIDHCNKYISRSLYNDTTVLVVSYEYNDSYVSVSVSTNNLVSYVIVVFDSLGIFM